MRLSRPCLPSRRCSVSDDCFDSPAIISGLAYVALRRRKTISVFGELLRLIPTEPVRRQTRVWLLLEIS